MREEEERILRKKRERKKKQWISFPFLQRNNNYSIESASFSIDSPVKILEILSTLFPSPLFIFALTIFFNFAQKCETVSENLKRNLSFIVSFNRMILDPGGSASFVQFKSFQRGGIQAGVFHHRSNNKGKNRDGRVVIYLSGGGAIFTVYVQFLVSSGVANPVAARGRGQRGKRKRGKKREKIEKGK